MKKIKLIKNINNTEFESKINFFQSFLLFISKKSHSILISINLTLTLYLIIKINNVHINHIDTNENSSIKSYFQNESKIDKDMIGLKYPEIMYDNVRINYIIGNRTSSFLDFLTQLEIKLIYLEKEINATKLNSFYTTRLLYLKNMNISYDDSKINKYNDIVNWLVIHKSTQLKGIASDKYLACRYVKLKLGKNLCPQRIGVYDKIEDIDLEKLIRIGNVVLKVSNGYDDNIFITKDKNIKDIENIKNSLIFHFNRDYPLMTPSFFHLYTQKRIVLEKMFLPRTDLFEFRFLIFNNNIKMIILNYIKNNRMADDYYDENFNLVKKPKKGHHNISFFDKNTLKTLKSYAIKLSEDFPNFIRVDLYIFHNIIYLSELTFDSHGGIPIFSDIKHFNEGVKTWKRVDY